MPTVNWMTKFKSVQSAICYFLFSKSIVYYVKWACQKQKFAMRKRSDRLLYTIWNYTSMLSLLIKCIRHLNMCDTYDLMIFKWNRHVYKSLIDRIFLQNILKTLAHELLIMKLAKIWCSKNKVIYCYIFQKIKSYFWIF